MLTAFRRPQGPVGSRPLTTCSAWAAHFHTLSIEWKGEGSNYCCIKFVNAHTARAIRSFGRPPRDVPRRTTHDARATRPTCGCGCWVVCPGVCGTWRAAGWRPAPCARAPRPPARAPPAAGTSMIVIYFIEIWRDPEEAHNTIHRPRSASPGQLDAAPWTGRRPRPPSRKSAPFDSTLQTEGRPEGQCYWSSSLAAKRFFLSRSFFFSPSTWLGWLGLGVRVGVRDRVRVIGLGLGLGLGVLGSSRPRPRRSCCAGR